MNDDSAIQDAKLMINCSSKEPRCANQPTTQPKVKCRDIFGQVKKTEKGKPSSALMQNPNMSCNAMHAIIMTLPNKLPMAQNTLPKTHCPWQRKKNV
jgi:hypothetical protein